MKRNWLILLLISALCSAQLGIKVRKIGYEENKTLIPKISLVQEYENDKRGLFFEITIINKSKNSVIISLDTSTYLIPSTDNLNEYFTYINIVHNPDIMGILGVDVFLY